MCCRLPLLDAQRSSVNCAPPVDPLMVAANVPADQPGDVVFHHGLSFAKALLQIDRISLGNMAAQEGILERFQVLEWPGPQVVNEMVGERSRCPNQHVV